MYYTSMELRHEPNPKITDTDTISRARFFYTRKEAADYAASIGWPKNSARLVHLPYGRSRWALSDPHMNILLIDPSCPHCGAPVAEEGCSNGLCEAVN